VALALAGGDDRFPFETTTSTEKWADSSCFATSSMRVSPFAGRSVVLVRHQYRAFPAYTDFCLNVFVESRRRHRLFPPRPRRTALLVQAAFPKRPMRRRRIRAALQKRKGPSPRKAAWRASKPVAELSKPVAALFVSGQIPRKTLAYLASASPRDAIRDVPSRRSGALIDIEIAGKTHCAPPPNRPPAPLQRSIWKDFNLEE